jgi:hypothetical protein
MAIARCEKHTPDGTKHNYRAYALPVGFPDTAAICGRPECEAPARLWLTDDDRAAFDRGIRVFNIRTNSAKLRVSDELISN